jgi:hypothetical protein
MPLPGGPTDKIGNRYEDAWTVYAMLEVMDERALAIRLEPPGEDGVEFWLRRHSALEHYQVKRQRCAGASWKSKEENDLRESIEALLQNLIDGPSATVYAVLAQLAKDSIHETLTAHSIWHHLQGTEQRFHRRPWANDPHVLAKAKEANDGYLRSQSTATIDGRVIPSDAAQGIVVQLTEPDNSYDILITGEAGSGKSCTFQQAVEKLIEKGTPVLTLRLDLLDPVLLPRGIGLQLDLPGSPVQVLADIAQGQRCILALDQLDAVVRSSDGAFKFLHCIDSLLEEARAYSHMRLLVTCRQFYLEHDEQIQQILSTHALEHHVMIERLTNKQIRQSVADMGWDAERLSEEQFELLSCPLHLSLLAKVPRTAAAVFDFRTANDLYQRFWTEKDRTLRRQLQGQPINWVSVMDALCNYMSDRQILFAPESVAYSSEFVVEAMVSEQLLIKTDKRYTFFHESFFDYAFARQFVSKRRKLMLFLLAGRRAEPLPA